VGATTAFNRIIAVDGGVVESVTFTPEGVVVGIRRRRRCYHCRCGWTTRAHPENGSRHLNRLLVNDRS
jgi:transcriptional regulator NrdR family protein